VFAGRVGEKKVKESWVIKRSTGDGVEKRGLEGRKRASKSSKSV